MDTGASVNVMDMDMIDRLLTRPRMALTWARIYAYGSSTPLQFQRLIEVTVTNANTRTRAKFHVTKDKTGTLLSCHTPEVLVLVFFVQTGAQIMGQSDKERISAKR